MFKVRHVSVPNSFGIVVLFLLLTRAASPPGIQNALSSVKPGGVLSINSRHSPAALPIFSHVYLVVLENHEYDQVVGNPNLPYLNALITQYALATNYHAIAHPSLPNYLALFGGSIQGIRDDEPHQFDGPSLADQLEAKGKTWQLFAQNVPTGCFTGLTSEGGADGPGQYEMSHNPAISFNHIRNSAARCQHIADFSHFAPEAADFEFIVPNFCNDMHNCAAAEGDRFLAGFIPTILTSPAWQQGGVLFITWDEGTSHEGGGGHVPLLVISNLVPAGFRSSVGYNHYSLVRTIEDAWGLQCLNEACWADSLRDFFP